MTNLTGLLQIDVSFTLGVPGLISNMAYVVIRPQWCHDQQKYLKNLPMLNELQKTSKGLNFG